MLPVTVVVPVLRRPHNAAPFMASLRESSPRTPLVMAVANRDDPTTAEAWRRAGALVGWCDEAPGSFAQKVNLASRFVLTDWMFLVGDDVAFHDQWIERALEGLPDHVKVVGVSEIPDDADLDRRFISPDYESYLRSAEHTNHMFVRCDYVSREGASWDGPGVVCGPYRHWWTNNELIAVAKQRGVWEARPGSVVEHLHPYFGKGQMDATYALGESAAQADHVLWMERVTKFAPELVETP
jgi:hypothetical protein